MSGPGEWYDLSSLDSDAKHDRARDAAVEAAEAHAREAKWNPTMKEGRPGLSLASAQTIARYLLDKFGSETSEHNADALVVLDAYASQLRWDIAVAHEGTFDARNAAFVAERALAAEEARHEFTIKKWMAERKELRDEIEAWMGVARAVLPTESPQPIPWRWQDFLSDLGFALIISSFAVGAIAALVLILLFRPS